MSDTDTNDPPERFSQPDPGSTYLQPGDPASFGGGYAGMTASEDRIEGGNEPPPSPGQVGARPQDTGQADRTSFTATDDPSGPDPNTAQWGDRWQRQGKSDHIPFGFRQYEPIGLPPFNNYIPTAMNPALRDRAPSDWGTPDYVERGMNAGPDGGMSWGNYVPTERDMPGIIHNATMVLGRFAPPQIGMPMINAGRQYLAGTQAYQKGALQAAQLNRQQAMDNMKFADRRLEELLRKYSSVFADYGPNPDKPGSDFDSDKFHEEIARVAMEYGDQYVLNMVNSKDWGALERHLKHLDGTGADLGKTLKLIQVEEAKQRLEKSRRENQAAEAENKRFGVGGAATTPATPGAPAGEGAPAPPAVAVPSATGDTPNADFPAANPELQRAAQAVQMGGKVADFAKSPGAKSAIEDQAQKLNQYIGGLVDKDIPPGQLKAMVQQANPALADKVNALLDGTETPTPHQSGEPATRLAMRIAKKIDPNWERNAVAQTQKRDFEFKREMSRPVINALSGQTKALSYMRATLGKNVLDMNQLENLLVKLKDKGIDTGSPYFDAIIRNARSRFAGDPDVAAFETQLALVRSDIGRLLTAGGLAGSGAVYPVSAQREMREFFDKGISVEQLRAINRQFKQDYQNKLGPLAKEINDLQSQAAGIWGRQPVAPVSTDALEDILQHAPQSSQPIDATPPMPDVGDVQDGFRFKGGDPSKQESWERVQ
jgi:hypothetical protein